MTQAQFDTSYYIARIDAFLQTYLEQQEVAAPRLKEAMTYSVIGAGKRIRPLLVYATGEIFGIPLEVLDILAAALELVHCYSLIHDDLPAMDNDDLRRGMPSCHKRFDEATAILAGNALQVLAIEILVDGLQNHLPAVKIRRINKIFLQAIGYAGLLSGQSLDLSELKKVDLPLETLYNIHALKTGKLICAAIFMVIALDDAAAYSDVVKGSACSRARLGWDIANLEDFAVNLGILFQIQDDFLDCYADSGVTGKKVASDANNHKYTFAHKFSRSELEDILNSRYSQAYEQLANVRNSCSLKSIVSGLKLRYQNYSDIHDKISTI
jgi:farnesyl diphosphate synthase